MPAMGPRVESEGGCGESAAVRVTPMNEMVQGMCVARKCHS